MLNKHQHIEKMITPKKHTAWFGMILVVIFMASCSSVSDFPNDDIYYSKKVKNNGEYNWDDFQKNAQSYNTGDVSKETSKGSSYSGGGDIATTVAGSDADGDNQYIDEYYESGYADRINRFGSNSTDNDFDYYDGYNSNSGCNCGQSSFSMGFGMGGYGSSWSMSYGYGYPGYGSSYMAGYNAGYNAGYYNGYWGYPYYGYGGYPSYGYGGYYGSGGGYYGGYYPEYNYASPSTVYGPRSSASGGTTVPRTHGGSGYQDDDNDKRGDIVVDSRGASLGGAQSGSVAAGSIRGTTSQLEKPGTGGQVSTRTTNETLAQEKMKRPENTGQTRSASGSKYKKPNSTLETRPQPKYNKPKSYQSLPSQKPRSSQEYVRPTTKAPATKSSSNNPYVRTSKPSNSNRTISTGSGSRKSSYTPSRSYSSPSRSTTTRSSSYSSPSRSSGSSTINRSSGGGSSSRSSGSSSGSRSSSSSSSRSSGGRR